MKTKPHKRMLLTLFSIIVIDLIGFGIVMPVLPFYAESYGASASLLGILLTSYAAMQFLFAPLWGSLSDKIGRRPVLLMTIAGNIGCLILLGAAPTLTWLFVARIMGGIFGANISVATAYVTDITPEEERTKGMGLIGAAFGIGFILGPALGGLLSINQNYSLPMYCAAGLSLLNWLYAFKVLAEPQRHKHPTDKNIKKTTLLKNPFIRKMSLIYLIYTFAMAQLESIFAFFMLDKFNYEVRDVAWILVLMALTMAIIQGGVIRRLSEHYSEKKLALAGAFLLIAAFIFIPEMPSVGLLIIPLIVSAIGRGISQPSLLSLISFASTPQNRGSVMGVFQSSASLARVIGPLVAGYAYDQGHQTPFLIAATCSIIVFGLLLRIHPQAHKKAV